jgi:ubiquinone biosynthesis protein UbiJ
MSDLLDATRIRKYVDQAAAELGIRMDGRHATPAQRQAVVAKAMGWIMEELEERIRKVESARQGATVEQRQQVVEAVAKLADRLEKLEASRAWSNGSGNGHVNGGLRGLLD